MFIHLTNTKNLKWASHCWFQAVSSEQDKVPYAPPIQNWIYQPNLFFYFFTCSFTQLFKLGNTATIQLSSSLKSQIQSPSSIDFTP